MSHFKGSQASRKNFFLLRLLFIQTFSGLDEAHLPCGRQSLLLCRFKC